MNVAEAVAEALLAEGVRVAAGITGQSIGQLADALALAPEMSLIYVRQERVAIDICDGFARACGQPAVAFTDAGPAVANAMGGLVNSWGDSSPVLLIAGHNPRFDLPQGQSKEIPFREMFGPVSKWLAIIEDGCQVEEVMRRAFMQLRTGRPGPVVIGLPVDVSRMAAAGGGYSPLASRPPVRSGGDPQAIEEAVRLMARAERPYLYTGAGILASDATPELVRFAELLTLPVATTLNGKGGFPEDHDLALGIGGFGRARYGSLPATVLAEEADLVMTVGCGFKSPATVKPLAQSFRHIQIDADAGELHKHHLADLAILGDAKTVLGQLAEAAERMLPPARRAPIAARREAIAGLKARWRAVSAPLVGSDEMPINPFRVTGELMRLTDPAKTILLHDAGTVRGSTAQHYLATVPRSFLGYGVQSAMGWSLGAAIGAKKAAPDKLVIAVIGEEAFGETAMDIETSVRVGAPILIIVKNNRAFFDRDGGASPNLARLRFDGGVDITAVAAALGAHSARIEDPKQLGAGLKAAIAQVEAGRTSLVEVMTKRVKTSLYDRWESAVKV